MEPVTYDEKKAAIKRKLTPNAELSCKHCGLWMVKRMDWVGEQWKCAIDVNHRYCEGRCSRYKPNFATRIKRLFKRGDVQ